MTRWPSAVAVACVALATLLPGSPASAKAVDVTVDAVALGDSYASGVGAGTETDGECRRTPGAYAAQWSQLDPDAVKLEVNACSGATTLDVRKNQLGELGQDTDLVTLQVGVNDLELITTLESCADPGQTKDCEARLEALPALSAALPAELSRLVDTIKDKAPKAKVALVGYPLPFTPECPKLPLPAKALAGGNAAIAGLNQLYLELAAIKGAVYVDVAKPFQGHEVCGNASWLVGAEGVPNRTVLHPTLEGQTKGYLTALVTTVGAPDKVLEWMLLRDTPRPSAEPSTGPSSSAAPGAGGSAGGLPLTGPNVWWLILVATVLVGGGAATYMTLRPKVIRVTSD
ncbi:SGNH/GDSL hydrolase family protein [Actinoplanes sp. NPDC089786]|uniref:SGNH/GDSL hydrolase family protein n=1 Tax=Actinoplanes sp. NPDC089786 TaxID=3155185 RepID=UPI0034294CEC